MLILLICCEAEAVLKILLLSSSVLMIAHVQLYKSQYHRVMYTYISKK